MNRRGFFKTVSMTLVGILFVLKTKRVLKCNWWGVIECGGQNGTLCPQCKYSNE